MTLANKVTIFRIITVPLIVIALFENAVGVFRVLFVISMLSDVVDGALARFRGERTALGTFLDPLADKLLLFSVFMSFTVLGWLPVWVFVAVLSRDIIIVLGWSLVFILTGNRLITPRPLGKLTTLLQMSVAVSLLFNFPSAVYHGFLYAMVTATILSAGDYMWVGNKRLSEIR